MVSFSDHSHVRRRRDNPCLRKVIAIHQRLVAETLGEEDGVALIDESGVVKQGDDSVGVAAQYSGSVGKVANSQ